MNLILSWLCRGRPAPVKFMCTAQNAHCRARTQGVFRARRSGNYAWVAPCKAWSALSDVSATDKCSWPMNEHQVRSTAMGLAYKQHPWNILKCIHASKVYSTTSVPPCSPLLTRTVFAQAPDGLREKAPNESGHNYIAPEADAWWTNGRMSLWFLHVRRQERDGSGAIKLDKEIKAYESHSNLWHVATGDLNPDCYLDWGFQL